MKISKLFHWLYALVMLLPIFAIGVTCGYAMFNKNAYQSYSGNTAGNETTENINFTDLQINEEYYLINSQSTSITSNNTSFTMNVSNVQNFGPMNNTANIPFNLSEVDYITVWNPNTLLAFELHKTNTSGYYYINSSSSFNFSFIYEGANDTQTNLKTIINDYLFEIEYLEKSYIDNVFYYSVDKVTENPLFSWAYNSFLSQPIVYIVNLFSMPTNHFVVELLSYWLAISIIWLVFDLVMYVPLLVHRWIDKGVLE